MARTLLVLLAFFTATSGTAQRGSTLTVSTFLRPKTADTRSLLISIGGTTMSADRIVLELPKRSIAESAKAELLPSGWTARRKGRRFELTGPEHALPIRVRLDFGSPEALEFVDVKVFSNKRVVHESRETPQPLDAVELVQDASEFVLLPPLLAPGEVFDLTVLDVRKTSGVWFLGGDAGIVTNAGTASRPILQMRVPDMAAPDRPLELSYVEPWGETAVRASVLEQSRIVPRDLPPPSTPRFGTCGTGTTRKDSVCTCGWFPSVESRRGVLVDGRPAGTPAAASQRSICLFLEAGPHTLTGTATAGFDSRNEQKAVAITLTRSMVGNLQPGQSATITWTVTGTNDPIRLRLRNTSPAVGTLAGGPIQTAITSGGAPNAVSRVVTGLVSGRFGIVAEIEEPLSDSGDQEYPRMIVAVFQRELMRIATETEAVARQWPPEPPRADVTALLDRIGSEIHRSLPYPELEAFREAIDAMLEQARRELRASVTRSDVVLIAARPRDEESESWIGKIVETLRKLGNESPLRRICIRTTPTGADVTLYPPKYPSDRRSTRSDDTLTFYRGLYRYEVVQGGSQQMAGLVNLLLDPEEVLDCRLPQQPDDSRLCRLIAGSVEGCP